MSHVYHKSPEMGGPEGMKRAKPSRVEVDPMDAPAAEPVRARMQEEEAEARSLRSAIELERRTVDDLDAPEPITLLAKERNQARRNKKNKALEGELVLNPDKSLGSQSGLHEAQESPNEVYSAESGRVYADRNEARNAERREAKESAPETPEQFVAKEVREVSKKEQKVSESWFRSFARGSRKVADAAGSLLKEVVTTVGQDIDDSVERGLFTGGFLSWKRGLESLSAKKGEYVKVSEDDEPGYRPEDWVDSSQPNAVVALGQEISRIPSEAVKGLWEAGDMVHNKVAGETMRADEFDEANFKPRSMAVEAFVGAADILGNLATAAGLGREGTRGVAREAWDRTAGAALNKGAEAMSAVRARPRAAVEAPAYMLGGFLSSAFDKLTGKNRREAQAFMKDVLTVEKDYSPEADWTSDLIPNSDRNKPDPEGEGLDLAEDVNTFRAAERETREGQMKFVLAEAYGGTAEFARFVKNGLTSFGRDSAKVFAWMRGEYEGAKEQLPEDSVEQKVTDVAINRLEVAATEANEIASQAEKAKVTFAESISRSRDNFQKALDQAESETARKARLIAQDKAGGRGVEMLRADQARLQRQREKYADAIAALDGAAKKNADAETRSTYQALLAETDAKLTQRAKVLENPTAIKGKARELIMAEMRELNQKADTYEAVLRSLDQLDNLTPETLRESAAV